MVLNYCEWHMRHGASCQSSSSPVTPKCSIDCRPSTQVTTAYSRSRSTGTNYSQPSATLCEVHICVYPSRDRASRRRDFNAHPSRVICSRWRACKMYSAPKSGRTLLWKISLRAPMAELRRTLVDDQAIVLAPTAARRADRWRCSEELLCCSSMQQLSWGNNLST